LTLTDIGGARLTLPFATGHLFPQG
jgi:hypothetical protein